MYLLSNKQPLRTKTLLDYNGGKGRMVCWHYSYMNATWITVFLPEDSGNMPPWTNMVVGEVQWYIGWYDPAETHNVPAVRFGKNFHISKAALWWREEASRPFLPENSSAQSYSWAIFLSSHWKSYNHCELSSSPIRKKAPPHPYLANLQLPQRCCQSKQTHHHRAPSPASYLQTCRSPSERKWWNTFHNAVKFKSSSHLPCLSWVELKLCHLAGCCWMANWFRPPIVSQCATTCCTCIVAE